MSHDQTTGEVDEPLEGDIIEPVGTGTLAVMHRVELDQQIATAKQFPRNVPMVKQELTALVTMDEETAEECIYALPRGNKTIKGPSARFADALISFWGNARSGAYVVQVDKEDKFVEAVGFFQDVERNVIRQRRVRRPIATAKGYLYNADMINMTGNAACVIAERNAILNGIPKPLWGPAYDKCFALVAGTTQTLGDKIARAKKAFLAMEVPFELVLEKIGRADESKIIPDDVVTLRGMLAALKNGEETSETIFGRGVGTPQHETVTNPLKDKKDPPAEEVRGSSHQIAEADKVIGEGGKVVKDREADDQQQGEQQGHEQHVRAAYGEGQPEHHVQRRQAHPERDRQRRDDHGAMIHLDHIARMNISGGIPPKGNDAVRMAPCMAQQLVAMRRIKGDNGCATGFKALKNLTLGVGNRLHRAQIFDMRRGNGRNQRHMGAHQPR